MERTLFIDTLTEIIQPNKYSKKRNTWFQDNGTITKIIEAQKSRYGNFFYLNYGFVLNSLDTKGALMHISYGMGSMDDKENERIKLLLNLESHIDDYTRKLELSIFFDKIVFSQLNRINDESDLKELVFDKKRLNLFQE